MKQAHQPWRVGVTVLVSGLILGLLAFFLIPVVLPGASDSAVAVATALPRLDPGAPVPDAAVLKSTMDSVLSQAGPGASVTASVIDVENAEELYSRSGGEPGIPASSLKVITAIAAVTTAVTVAMADAWLGLRLRSKIITVASSCIDLMTISSSLPRPSTNFGSSESRT